LVGPCKCRRGEGETREGCRRGHKEKDIRKNVPLNIPNTKRPPLSKKRKTTPKSTKMNSKRVQMDSRGKEGRKQNRRRPRRPPLKILLNRGNLDCNKKESEKITDRMEDKTRPRLLGREERNERRVTGGRRKKNPPQHVKKKKQSHYPQSPASSTSA